MYYASHPTKTIKSVKNLAAESGLVHQKICQLKELKLVASMSFAGRAPAQAVSHRFPTAVAWVKPGSGHVGFMADKVALGQVFSEYFGFPCQFAFHRLLHNHLSSGVGTVGQKWPQYEVGSVTPQKKNVSFNFPSSCIKSLLVHSSETIIPIQ
jgi:hypothetical protein